MVARIDGFFLLDLEDLVVITTTINGSVLSRSWECATNRLPNVKSPNMSRVIA